MAVGPGRYRLVSVCRCKFACLRISRRYRVSRSTIKKNSVKCKTLGVQVSQIWRETQERGGKDVGEKGEQTETGTGTEIRNLFWSYLEPAVS